MKLRRSTTRVNTRIDAAARALPFPFTLTGRTENFLRGRLDLDDTITRLKAYQAAGADALMAPGLPDLEAVRAVCAATEKPFNFMVGIKGKSFTVVALAAAGVKRAAMTGLRNAAKEVREHGTFSYIDASLATPEMNAFLREQDLSVVLNRSARSLFNQGTFTARRERRDAPIPDLPALTGNVDVRP